MKKEKEEAELILTRNMLLSHVFAICRIMRISPEALIRESNNGKENNEFAKKMALEAIEKMKDIINE